MLPESYPAELHVSLEGRRDLVGQIYRQVREAILDGRLRRGEPLPPSRELGRRLAVSRTTVTMAYDRLAAEGFTGGRVGAGTYVTGEPHPAGRADAAPAGPLQPREIWAHLPDAPSPGDWRYNLSTGVPDARLFPYQRWRALMSRELRAGAVGAGAYADPAGHAGLRAEIARHVGVARSVRTVAEDVIVTSGMQQALFLLGRVMLAPGDTVAVENPGYPPAHDVLRSLDLRLVGVPVDADGLVVDAIPPQARMVYVTPSHQFPLGTPMTLGRRIALLAWADRCGGIIAEDDYDSEFRFDGRPIEPLQSLDRSGRVCYIGTFSKVMLPTLRLGFLVAPPALRTALRRAKYVTDWHSEMPAQGALARFIGDGGLSAHIRRMRTVYRERHDLVADLLAGELRPWLQPVPSAVGLHLTARSPGLSVADIWEVADGLEQEGVGVIPLSAFEFGVTFMAGAQTQAGLVIGYGMVNPDEIRTALSLLRDSLASRYPAAPGGLAGPAGPARTTG
jgi:GntR family transcriptional regulator / MocR family aminotransferase